MAEKDFTILTKAEELAEHTLRITSNCNHYPKKYRHSLVDKMQNKSLDIYTTLYEANRINNVTNKYEPKERDIKTAAFKDKVVQHSLCDNVLLPKLSQVFIKENSAGQKGKGTLYALDLSDRRRRMCAKAEERKEARRAEEIQPHGEAGSLQRRGSMPPTARGKTTFRTVTAKPLRKTQTKK